MTEKGWHSVSKKTEEKGKRAGGRAQGRTSRAGGISIFTSKTPVYQEGAGNTQ